MSVARSLVIRGDNHLLELQAPPPAHWVDVDQERGRLEQTIDEIYAWLQHWQDQARFITQELQTWEDAFQAVPAQRDALWHARTDGLCVSDAIAIRDTTHLPRDSESVVAEPSIFLSSSPAHGPRLVHGHAGQPGLSPISSAASDNYYAEGGADGVDDDNEDEEWEEHRGDGTTSIQHLMPLPIPLPQTPAAACSPLRLHQPVPHYPLNRSDDDAYVRSEWDMPHLAGPDGESTELEEAMSTSSQGSHTIRSGQTLGQNDTTTHVDTTVELDTTNDDDEAGTTTNTTADTAIMGVTADVAADGGGSGFNDVSAGAIAAFVRRGRAANDRQRGNTGSNNPSEADRRADRCAIPLITLDSTVELSSEEE